MKKFLQALIIDLINDWNVATVEINTDYTDDFGCFFTVTYMDGSEKEGFLSTTGEITI